MHRVLKDGLGLAAKNSIGYAKLSPIPDVVGTIFPFRVQNNSLLKEYVELPYTLP